jgi:hypothetical protein
VVEIPAILAGGQSLVQVVYDSIITGDDTGVSTHYSLCKVKRDGNVNVSKLIGEPSAQSANRPVRM